MYLAIAVHLILPSALAYCVGTPEGPLSRGMDFAAHSPACTYPCQRFTPDLTIDGA